MLALIDHQTGLMKLVDNERPTPFKSIVIALAKLARLHELPVVIPTSAEDGPNGPFLPEVLALLSADSFSVPHEELRSIESLLTVAGGEVVHAAGPFADARTPSRSSGRPAPRPS